jgi:FKBP-type peptidyl-prolyl cis-trans isomerase FkpA
MKNKINVILTLLLVALLCWSCKNGKSISSPAEENFDKDASYALGMDFGLNIKQSLDMNDIYPNIDELMKGFRDSLTGKDTRFNPDEAIDIIETAFYGMAIQRENTFLAENSKKPGINITPSGLQYEIIKQTEGPKPLATDIVTVHYEGRLIDGTVFDSSYDRREPTEFPVNEVIPGWTEGLQLMSIGSSFLFYIPSELGYGPSGYGPIPPYAALIFTVELLDINHGE